MNTLTSQPRLQLLIPLFALPLLLLFAGMAIAEPGIEAQLSHTSIPLNRAALLTVTVTGSQQAEIQMPKVKNITIYPRGTSRQFSMINGKTSSSVTYNYLLQGDKTGKYRIPPIEATVDGKQMKTYALTFEIVDQIAQQTPAQPQRNFQGQQQIRQQSSTQARTLRASDIAFLQVKTEKKSYLGESVPVEIKAYFNTAIRIEPGSISLPTLSGEGLSMNPLSTQPKQTQEEHNGQTWYVLTWNTTLNGIKTGKQDATITMNATAMIPEQSRRRHIRDPFDTLFGGSAFDDPFFDNAFTQYIQKPIQIKKQLSFEILDTPGEEKPADYSGAVGDFDLSASARVNKIEVGEPFVLTVKVKGEGNFDQVDIPNLPENDAFRTYPPTVKFNPMGKLGAGEKTFEQAVVIKDNRITEIPPLSFSYFDPNTKKYVTKTTNPIPIKVTGASYNALPPAAPQPTNQQTTEPITAQNEKTPIPETNNSVSSQIPLKVDIGSLGSELRPLPARTLFQLACVLLFLAALSLAVIRYVTSGDRRESRHSRLKAARNRLTEDLAKVDSARKNGDGRLFLNASRVAIQNQLARRCSMHPSAVSLGDLRQVLPASSKLLTIFERADQASYGGEIPDKTEMNTLFSQLRSALEELQ